MSESNSSNWVGWTAFAIAIIALILTIVIWILFFLAREGVTTQFDPVWKVSQLSSSNTSIDGVNFTLYVIPTGLTGTTLTINTPSDVGPGQWFIVTNQSDRSANIRAGSGVTFQSFPITTSNGEDDQGDMIQIPIATEADLPAKTSWVVAWADTGGTAINLIPGGITQS